MLFKLLKKIRAMNHSVGKKMEEVLRKILKSTIIFTNNETTYIKDLYSTVFLTTNYLVISQKLQYGYLP